MLVLCREGKVELVGNHLNRVLHFEEDEEPAGRTGLVLALQTTNLLRRSRSRLKLSRR
jgi:hypothetical protein